MKFHYWLLLVSALIVAKVGMTFSDVSIHNVRIEPSAQDIEPAPGRYDVHGFHKWTNKNGTFTEDEGLGETLVAADETRKWPESMLDEWVGHFEGNRDPDCTIVVGKREGNRITGGVYCDDLDGKFEILRGEDSFDIRVEGLQKVGVKNPTPRPPYQMRFAGRRVGD